MAKCIFCRMVDGEIQPDVVYEDENILAFRDANPQAPTHVLLIPKLLLLSGPAHAILAPKRKNHQIVSSFVLEIQSHRFRSK